MPSVQAARPNNGYGPPPSSILVTHVVNGDNSQVFDQTNFNQLLEELLGSDENGQPNLGSDVAVNHKLITIILRAGIDPLIEDTSDNPFRSNGPDLKNDALLTTCLDVLRLAIERAPQVLFVKSVPEDHVGTENEVPLYIWLIPKLFPLIIPNNPKNIQDGALGVVASSIKIDIDESGAADALQFVHGCISVLLDHAASSENLGLQDAVILDDDEFTLQMWKLKILLDGMSVRLRFATVGDMFFSVSKVLGLLSSCKQERSGKIQFRKQLNRIEQLVDPIITTEPETNHLNDILQDLRFLKLTSQSDPVLQSHPSLDETWPDYERARKRPRLSTELDTNATAADFQTEINCRLTGALCGYPVTDLDGLSKTAPAHFRRLSEEQQCGAIDLLGSSACQLASGSHQPTCFTCNATNPFDQNCTTQAAPELMRTLLAIVSPQTRSTVARTSAMSSLKHILGHDANLDDFRLAQSPAGEWCLQSLRSSSRDLRLAAINVLQVYVMERKADTSLTRDNRIIALDFLHNLWQKNDVASQETVVLALTRMAEVVGDEELNIILLRLVEYLGHSNPYISGLVYAEIQQLAQTLQITVAVLFRPFWRTLGLVVVKAMSARPLISQQLCDLLGMQGTGLMLLIEEYALPYLILNKNQNLINNFAAAHGASASPFDICTHRKNLTAILSFLLVQVFQDHERKIMDLLLDVSDEFGAEDLPGWLAHDPIQIACELLKAIGDAGEGKASRTYQALQSLAQILARKPGLSNPHTRRSDTTGSFLEANVLAIVTHFTVLLNDLEAKEPKLEKRRCLVALGEVVKIGKGRVVVALPQICACLRSALEDPDLCNAAFIAWSVVIGSLKEEDLAPLVDQTLAIIVRGWEAFDTATQDHAYRVVANLLEQHTSLVRDIFETMPSLSSIPVMSKFETEIGNLKRQMDERHQLIAYVARLKDENITVIEQALTELSPLLRTKQDVLHRAILQDPPDSFVADLTRALLDCCVKFQTSNISRLCGQCLGSVGCLDPNKIETTAERNSILVLSNFAKAEETVDFIMFFLENVLVKAFLSASTTRGQGFLGWAMQEFLKLCAAEDSTGARIRPGPSTAHRRWQDLPEGVKTTLTPFLTSKYLVQEVRPAEKRLYPFFAAGMRHRDWLRSLAMDLLHRGSGDNVQLIFNICCRIINGQDTAIPAFLLPYAALNLVISGVQTDTDDIAKEICHILNQPLQGKDRKQQDEIKLCSQSIFEVLDYVSTWLQQKRKQYSVALARERGAGDPLLDNAAFQIKNVERLLESIPPELLSQRAIECKSYARALFHWEQYMRRSTSENLDFELARLQDIYAQIEEPDGIEGISSQMQVVDIQQRVLEHKKSGRWTAAQSWYQMQTNLHPDDVDFQRDLMDCLKQSGQHEMLLDRFQSMMNQDNVHLKTLKPYAVEAACVTGDLGRLPDLLASGPSDDFASHLGEGIWFLFGGGNIESSELFDELYKSTAGEFTRNSINSFQSCHDTSLKLQALEDVRLVAVSTPEDREDKLRILGKRLDILGSNVAERQYLLGLRRTVMSIRSDVFSEADIASSWLLSARLARKAQAFPHAFDAVMKASAHGDKSATIEEAKLMWQEGHHRKAIQALEGTIESGAFVAHDYVAEDGPATLTGDRQNQNEVTAKAYLLLGKWLDRSGQTQSEIITRTFRKSTENFRRGEKGWYYLGRHYNKLLDSEKLMPPGKESQTFLTGEMAKLVIENYLKSLLNGSKYVFQTLPKILTLWFELIAGSEQPVDSRRGSKEFQAHSAAHRRKIIEDTNAYIKKYLDRIQPVILYTILPQVLARITHPSTAVHGILATIVIKVTRAFPQQALWSLLPVVKSQSKERGARGLALINKVVEANKKASAKELSPSDLRNLITASQRLSDEVLRISEFPIEGKVSKVSLARDLGFNHKIAPSRLVVPSESFLIPAIPTSYEASYLKTFRPFAKEPITITAFLDEALVLSSLQKPRRLDIRGSDGSVYGVLAKPKDDLRKDQRLMEFNTMINRFLKRDVEASKRRLYIRTYAVIPLNEENGLIEWVNNLKTLRDILLKLYKDRSVVPNYAEIRNRLDEASSGSPEKVDIFANKVLKQFPAVFHEWFVESFPDPSTWFNARLKYTRSCAVMSICGHVLGLGDRHGENILFEEDNGSLMHVDFNCLFDKGLTFEKPEMVPFRLTHNMVDAMGAYRYEGPFRRCCEITLTLLRGNEDALMTILETFLHDPTTDFIEKGRRKKQIAGVPDTPMEVLDGVRSKTRGMLAGESVPLSVGGYVEEMIKRATDHKNLCRMYIGWCAFF